MASRKTFLIITALLLILASTCVFADRDDDYYGMERGARLWLSGIVSDIDYGSEVFAIKDGSRKYTIIAEDTRTELRNGTIGRLRDVKEGMMVRIEGERITSSQYSARTIIILDDSGKFDNGRNTGAYYYNDQTRTEGYITEINARATQIHIRANRENYVVDITAGTEIRRSSFLTGFSGLRKDDRVSVTGTPRGRGRIDARYIEILTDRDYRYDDSYNHRVGTVEGTISSTTGYFDRSIAIRTTYGEVKVDVTKSADVRLDGRSVSIHNISKGVWARAYGEWDGNTLTASRVDAYSSGSGRDYPGGGYRPGNPPVYPQTRVGVITSIDIKKNILKLDIGLTDMTVNTANAEVTYQANKISLSRLQKGDKVQVAGDYSAETLKARTVQVLKWAEEMKINEKW